MTFKENIKDDFNNIMDSGEFSEPIAYYPKSGSVQTINAVVKRNITDEAIHSKKGVNRIQAEIWVSKTDIPVVSKRLDKVRFPEHIGKPNIDWLVLSIIDSDILKWHLLVGK